MSLISVSKQQRKIDVKENKEELKDYSTFGWKREFSLVNILGNINIF